MAGWSLQEFLLNLVRGAVINPLPVYWLRRTLLSISIQPIAASAIEANTADRVRLRARGPDQRPRSSAPRSSLPDPWICICICIIIYYPSSRTERSTEPFHWCEIVSSLACKSFKRQPRSDSGPFFEISARRTNREMAQSTVCILDSAALVSKSTYREMLLNVFPWKPP